MEARTKQLFMLEERKLIRVLQVEQRNWYKTTLEYINENDYIIMGSEQFIIYLKLMGGFEIDRTSPFA
jgi:hypothetical protein